VQFSTTAWFKFMGFQAHSRCLNFFGQTLALSRTPKHPMNPAKHLQMQPISQECYIGIRQHSSLTLSNNSIMNFAQMCSDSKRWRIYHCKQ